MLGPADRCQNVRYWPKADMPFEEELHLLEKLHPVLLQHDNMRSLANLDQPFLKAEAGVEALFIKPIDFGGSTRGSKPRRSWRTLKCGAVVKPTFAELPRSCSCNGPGWVEAVCRLTSVFGRGHHELG
jgi:hypothetical protein